ncbi:general secretion pathway protein GspB [Agarivorans sp. Z349TD_8]|uniref:general secretion pathway protein GspB n=1 Tax=Agarivorans sp. Z349TD_8 TaxID=3421434 RepID=UPI003D7E9F83
MSSILAAQRRSQQGAMAALVPRSPNNRLWFVLFCVLLTLVLLFAGLWWWQKLQVVPRSGSAPPIVADVAAPAPAPVPAPVFAEPQKPRLAPFELNPLPDFKDLERVDLLAMRQAQYADLIANTSKRLIAQEDKDFKPVVESSPTASTEHKPAQPTNLKSDLSLEQRFAQAVQATESLNWQEQQSTAVYDDAPLLAELSPELQALVPAITFKSHVFSSDPARRHVTLNEQQLFEGDLLTNRIELVAIRLNDIVLRVAGNLCRLKALVDWG